VLGVVVLGVGVGGQRELHDFATRSTFHAARFWLNEDAPLNVQYMFDTLAVFHSPMGWLKKDADSNVEVLAFIRTVVGKLAACRGRGEGGWGDGGMGGWVERGGVTNLQPSPRSNLQGFD
jgi:hypothetical protein